MNRLHLSRLLLILGALIRLETPALSGAHTDGPFPVLCQRITAADHIVATNWAATDFGERGFSVPVAAGEVKGIIKAVSAATFCGTADHPAWEWGWQLRFYCGTNFLAAICFGGDTFLVYSEGVYRDGTGVLDRVYRDCANREYVAKVYKDEDKDFADAVKAEAKQWLRSPVHKILDDKRKVVRYVNKFYAAGAAKVFVTDIETYPIGKNPPWENAKYLCVVLPHDPEARGKVFRVHWEAVFEWGIDADDDVGQKYLWYPIDWHHPPKQVTSAVQARAGPPFCGVLDALGPPCLTANVSRVRAP